MSSPAWSVYEGEWGSLCDDADSVPSCLALSGCGLRQKRLLQRGAQGAVYLAEDVEGNLFAVKRHFTQRSDFGVRGISEGALREATLLKCIAAKADALNLSGDFGVLRLHRVVEAPFQELCLILEMCPLDLSKIYLRGRKTTHNASLYSAGTDVRCPVLAKVNVIQYLMRGILTTLRCLHEDCRIIHRDVKLSNLLVGDDGRVRLADFGSARLLHDGMEESAAASCGEYTPAALRTTVIYQAPECLLGRRSYTTAVDMWAAGVVFAELLLQQHLFSGYGELAMLCEIWKLLGTPSDGSLGPSSEGAVTYAVCTEPTLSLRFPGAIVPPEGLHLLQQLLQQDPEKRITAAAALRHPFLCGLAVDEGQAEARQLWRRKVQECLQEAAQKTAAGVPLLYVSDEEDADDDNDNGGERGDKDRICLF